LQLADKIIIVNNGTITYQGTYTELQENPNQVKKLSLERHHNDVEQAQAQAAKSVQGQNQKLSDAKSDLKRATGDFSLYGKDFTPAYHLMLTSPT
jgi:ABC-type multidrug transport system ATPase subunit